MTGNAGNITSQSNRVSIVVKNDQPAVSVSVDDKDVLRIRLVTLFFSKVDQKRRDNRDAGRGLTRVSELEGRGDWLFLIESPRPDFLGK